MLTALLYKVDHSVSLSSFLPMVYVRPLWIPFCTNFRLRSYSGSHKERFRGFPEELFRVRVWYLWIRLWHHLNTMVDHVHFSEEAIEHGCMLFEKTSEFSRCSAGTRLNSITSNSFTTISFFTCGSSSYSTDGISRPYCPSSVMEKVCPNLRLLFIPGFGCGNAFAIICRLWRFSSLRPKFPSNTWNGLSGSTSW